MPHKLLLLGALALAMFLATTNAPAPLQAQETQPLSELAGTYVYAGGAEQKAVVDTMVEKVVQQVAMVFRPLARPRLQEVCAAAPKAIIKVEGDTVEMIRGDAKVWKSKADGKAFTATNDEGEPIAVSRKWTNGVLLEYLHAEKGSRTMTYKLSKNKQLLSIKTVIRSPQLPQSLVFEYTYKRQ